MEPFVLQNPKGFCKMNSSHCPPRAVPGQWLGCVPGWEGRAPCSPTASPVPPSVASTHSCPAYFGNGNEVHGPTLNWLGRTGIAWPMPRHQLPHCPRHSFSKGTPPGDSQKSPTSKKPHFFMAPAKKRQPQRSAPRCCSTQRHATLTQGRVTQICLPKERFQRAGKILGGFPSKTHCVTAGSGWGAECLFQINSNREIMSNEFIFQ